MFQPQFTFANPTNCCTCFRPQPLQHHMFRGRCLLPTVYCKTKIISISRVPLSPGTKLLLYADDVVMYRPVNSQYDVSSLQNDVNSVHCYTIERGLALNTSESHLMTITHSRNALPTNLIVDITWRSSILLNTIIILIER